MKKHYITSSLRTFFIFQSLLIMFLSLIYNTNLYGQTVKVHLTKGDQSTLLQEQPSRSFSNGTISNATITINEQNTFQTMDGFGFALTQGSAQVLNTLNSSLQNSILNELFRTSNGVSNISMIRISIGASDLSNSVYYYNDTPGDVNMNNFSLNGPDSEHLIPIIQKILAINPNIKILATPWSAPTWMKTNRNSSSNPSVGGSLDTQFYSAYARYFVRYLQEMENQGISIWGITPQNEPENPFNEPSMLMSSNEQLNFINNHLGPQIQNAGFTPRIIAFDHNCDNPGYPINVLNNSSFTDGAAFHFYAGDISAMSEVHDQTGKNIYFTEQFTSSNGQFNGDLGFHMENVVIGSMRNWSKAVLEWNLAADPQSNPRTPGGCSECLGAITVNNSNSITRNVSYYIISQISKFVKPGAVRLESNANGILNVAVRNPNGEKVLLVYNRNDQDRNISINWNGKSFTYNLDGRSAVTFTWNDPSSSDGSELLDTWYRFKNVATGRYLDSNGFSMVAGTSNSGFDKQWRFFRSGDFFNIESRKESGDGRGIIRAQSSTNRVLGTNLTPRPDADKQWSVSQLNDGSYRIRSRSANRNMINNTSNTITLSVSTSNRTKWILEPVASARQSVSPSQEIIKEEKNTSINVFPNPIKDTFTISLNGFENANIVISDLFGKIYYEHKMIGGTIDIPTANKFRPNVYILSVTSQDGEIYNEKLIIE